MTVEIKAKMTVERDKKEKNQMVQGKDEENSEVQQRVFSEGKKTSVEQKSSISPEENWLLRERKVKERSIMIFYFLAHLVQLNSGVFTPKV